MKSRIFFAVFTVIGLVAATGETRATEKLVIRVTPNVSSAPSTVVVVATVAKNAANRWLQIEADSGGFYRSSTVQLDGSNAPLVSEFRLPGLPGGEYTVSAMLKTDRGEITTARHTVLVLSRFGEEP
jgi:hypothetical protein